MKKVILSIVIVACAAMIIHAQEIPERKREESKPVIKEKIINKKERANLNLTDEQKAKLKSMNQDLRKKMEELRKQESLTVKGYREKMEAIRKEHQDKFQSVLTPDQKIEMQKYKDAANAKTKVFGEKRQARMREELNLSDEQLGKIRENRKAMAEKIKTIKEDKSLNDEKRKEEIREAMKGQKEKMKSILTEEQLQKMKENRKERAKKRRVI